LASLSWATSSYLAAMGSIEYKDSGAWQVERNLGLWPVFIFITLEKKVGTLKSITII